VVYYILEQYKDINWLKHEYIENKSSMVAMSKMCDINKETIRFWLQRYNIPVRSRSEISYLMWSKVRTNITKEELREKFLRKGFSISEEEVMEDNRLKLVIMA